jgi:hypothetical protein
MRNLLLSLVVLSVLPVLGTSQQNEARTIKDPPADFVGDGCTMFPDGDYADCCLAHDRDYYRGGTREERRASDKRLKECVRARGHKYLSKLMFFGVRLGGGAWLNLPFSWGFGQRNRK